MIGDKRKNVIYIVKIKSFVLRSVLDIFFIL